MKSWCNRAVLFSMLFFTGVQIVKAAADTIAYPVEPALNVELVLHQQEIAVDVTSTAPVAMQFGLIGALVGAAIDNANAQAAEKRVVDIRNLLVDYDFNRAAEDAVQSAVSSPGISPKPVITVRKSGWDAVAEQGNAMTGPQQTLLRLIPHYAIASNFESIKVSLQAYYLQRTVKDSGKIKESVIFSRNYSYELPLEKKQGSGADEDADRWVAIGKDGMATLIGIGIRQTADMLAYDFSIEGREQIANAKSGKTTQFYGKSYRGTVLRETPDYIWVANGKIKARSVIGVQPVAEATAAAHATAPEAAQVPAEASVPASEPTKE